MCVCVCVCVCAATQCCCKALSVPTGLMEYYSYYRRHHHHRQYHHRPSLSKLQAAKFISPHRWSSVQFSPLMIGSSSGHEGRFSGDLPVFSHHGTLTAVLACPLFDVVLPAFLLPATASPTLQGALKDSFGEAVVACDTPEPCKQ